VQKEAADHRRGRGEANRVRFFANLRRQADVAHQQPDTDPQDNQPVLGLRFRIHPLVGPPKEERGRVQVPVGAVAKKLEKHHGGGGASKRRPVVGAFAGGSARHGVDGNPSSLPLAEKT